eukprot:SAG22_NODE_203_length_15320_cov_14.023516_8_plen_75_part_00
MRSCTTRQILWGWVAEEGPSPHPGEDWSSIQSLPRVVLLDPTNQVSTKALSFCRALTACLSACLPACLSVCLSV